MATLKDTFLGVPNGEIYPIEYKAGDECPPELESAARSLGLLEDAPAPAPAPAPPAVPEAEAASAEPAAKKKARD